MTEPAASLSPQGGDLVYRQRRPVRLWHWLNAVTVIVMLMSGLMIFNAHPQLYWGQYGAEPATPWLEIGSTDDHAGFLRISRVTIPTTGVLGVAGGAQRAFPPLVTIPSSYDLAGARQWHFFFAWLLVVPGLLFWLWGVVSRHVQRDLAPTASELRPAHIWQDIKNHARLRFHTGDPRRYNILQKLSYVGVIFGLLPAMVLTGLTMSPGVDAAWPWLLDLFGGRQSARSIHFICAALVVGFIFIHLLMVVLAGPFNEIRSIITGWYRLPNAILGKEKTQ